MVTSALQQFRILGIPPCTRPDGDLLKTRLIRHY